MGPRLAPSALGVSLIVYRHIPLELLHSLGITLAHPLVYPLHFLGVALAYPLVLLLSISLDAPRARARVPRAPSAPRVSLVFPWCCCLAFEVVG